MSTLKGAKGINMNRAWVEQYNCCRVSQCGNLHLAISTWKGVFIPVSGATSFKRQDICSIPVDYDVGMITWHNSAGISLLYLYQPSPDFAFSVFSASIHDLINRWLEPCWSLSAKGYKNWIWMLFIRLLLDQKKVHHSPGVIEGVSVSGFLLV